MTKSQLMSSGHVILSKPKMKIDWRLSFRVELRDCELYMGRVTKIAEIEYPLKVTGSWNPKPHGFPTRGFFS